VPLSPGSFFHRECRPGGWELLDYGDVVVQLLSAEQRSYYDLE
jgi:ribosomal silencing factor RsfS